MSYEILYGKQFIMIDENRVLPMICSGSNNCTEQTSSGRWRRERNWQVWKYYTGGKLIIDNNELLQNVKTRIDEDVTRRMQEPKEWNNPESGHYTDEEIRSAYGYFSSLSMHGAHGTGKTTADQFYNFFKNGIKNALTLEQLAEKGISVRFFTYCYDKAEADKEPLADEYAHSTEELLMIVELRSEYYDGTKVGGGEAVTFSPHGERLEHILKAMRHKDRPAKEKKQIATTVFFTLCNSYGSLVKYTSRGFKYSSYNDCGKRYLTAAEAEKKRQELIKKGKYKASEWVVTEQKTNSPVYITV